MAQFLKFIRSKFAQDEILTDIDDYVAFDEGNRVGFPAEVVSFDYCDEKGALLLGTKDGQIIVYAANGVTISHSIHEPDLRSNSVLENVVFMSSGIIFALCRGGHITQYKLREDVLIRIADHPFPLVDRSFRWPLYFIQRNHKDCHNLLFVYGKEVMWVEQHRMQFEVIVSENDLKKWLPSSLDILDISASPTDMENVLIVLEQGNVALFRDGALRSIFKMINSDGSPVRMLKWDPAGHFAYGIGENHRYAKWKIMFGSLYEAAVSEIDETHVDQPGPYPCTPLEYFDSIRGAKEDTAKNDIVIYKGGKIRANYDDRNIVTIRHAKKCIAFEVLGDVIGVRGIKGGYDGSNKEGVALIATTTELIGIDLDSEDWKTMRPSIFFSVNNSTPTCQTRTINIDESLWKTILKYGDSYWNQMNYSSREWPLVYNKRNGLKEMTDRAAYRQIHLTGHASGAILLWASGGRHMFVICVIRTASEFNGFIEPNYSGTLALEDGVEPGIPIAKIGDFDPYEDDLNLAITQLYLDSKKGTLIATNKGGFVLIYDIFDKEQSLDPALPQKILWERPLKGNTNTIEPRDSARTYPAGYQPTHKECDYPSACWYQISPNVDLTAIGFMNKYNCLVIGSDSGFVFIDIKRNSVINKELLCTEEGAVEATQSSLSRYKTLKKSLRRTFRRTKRCTAALNISMSSANTSSSRLSPQKTNGVRSMGSDSGSSRALGGREPQEIDDEVQFVERQIEARSDLPDASPSCIVTCIKVLRLPVTNKTSIDDLVVIGTSGGKILFYRISEAKVGEKFSFDATRVETIKLDHQQPIVNMDLSCEEGYFSALSTRLVVFTEEQIRLYSFPGKVKTCRYKMTSVEGVRIKKGIVVKLLNKNDLSQSNMFALVVSNEGHLRVHSLQDPALYCKIEVLNVFDIMGMTSVVLTQDGEVTFLKRESEFQRCTINRNYRGWVCQ